MPKKKNIPKESSKAKDAYYLYESLGPDRSIAKVAVQLGHSPGYQRTLEDWSRWYGWVKRAQAYDDEQLEKKRKARDKAYEEMNERHAQIGITQQKTALEVIKRLKSVRGKGGIGAIAAVQLLKLSTDLERLARGAATEQLAITGKDGGPIETDIVVETFWGRGTDPRKRTESDDDSTNEESSQDEDEDTELTVEIDVDD